MKKKVKKYKKKDPLGPLHSFAMMNSAEEIPV